MFPLSPLRACAECSRLFTPSACGYCNDALCVTCCLNKPEPGAAGRSRTFHEALARVSERHGGALKRLAFDEGRERGYQQARETYWLSLSTILRLVRLGWFVAGVLVGIALAIVTRLA